MSSSPHQMNIGWREVRTRRTVTRRLCGQVWGGPSEVFDQSKARVRAPSSPPPAKKSPTSSPSIRKNLTQTPAAEPYVCNVQWPALGSQPTIFQRPNRQRRLIFLRRRRIGIFVVD